MQKSLTVTTGSRLHFGLFSVGQVENQPKFGGCGLMIGQPGFQIRLTHDNQFSVVGPELELTKTLIQSWFERLRDQTDSNRIEDLHLKIEVLNNVPRHSGFGSGTQLALGIGAALCNWFQLNELCQPTTLSQIMDRGRRSSIGTHGFFDGGFLVDRGKRSDDQLAKLDLRIDFPDWPILLLRLKNRSGVHGKKELEAFKSITKSSVDHRNQMIDVVKQRIAPAVAQNDYDAFGNALFEYGRTSGSAYASVQGGDFHSGEVEELVYLVRHYGVPAVGQSSWGPCVFAIARDDEMAASLQGQLQTHYGDDLSITRTSALNQGARIKWQDLE